MIPKEDFTGVTLVIAYLANLTYPPYPPGGYPRARALRGSSFRAVPHARGRTRSSVRAGGPGSVRQGRPRPLDLWVLASAFLPGVLHAC